MEVQRCQGRISSSPLDCGMVLFLLFLLVHGAGTCGPGKKFVVRENRAVPMKIREHIPDTSENSFQASGPSKRLKVGSDGYKELIINADPNIIFREDKAGNNRRMSGRCERKLKTLSTLVRNYWNGEVKVRVIRSYDDGMMKKKHHGPHSLHFSGRAIDITTSDEKRDKLPMLGRLAYRAGFDWVYRAKAYIHASVKSDEEDGVQDYRGCFDANSTVQLEHRSRINIANLRVGDKVASVDSYGNVIYSPIVMFMHYSPKAIMDYIIIRTENQSSLVITPTHLIYRINKHSMRDEVCFAKDVAVGDLVYSGRRRGTRRLTAGRVSSIARVQRVGAFAPLTQSGNLIVDNILASCYAVIQSETIAHWSLAPVRFTAHWCPRCFEREPGDSDIHWYPQTLLTFYSNLVNVWGGFL